MDKNYHYCFDLDGTLIDSIPLMRRSWDNVCEVFGLDIPWTKYQENVGLQFKTICNNLNIGLLSDEIAEVYFSFNKKNYQTISPMPQLNELLNRLHDEKQSWSIITSKPRHSYEKIASHFKLDPKLVICGDDLTMGKPDKEGGQILCNNLALDCKEVIYIGDTLIDHLFAINSGFRFAGFKRQEGSHQKIIGNQFLHSPLIMNDFKRLSNLMDVFSL